MNGKIKQYIECVNNGLLKTTGLKILHFAKHNEVTTVYHLRKHLKQPHQTITGVLSNLMDDGLIYEVGGSIKLENKHYSALKYTDDPELIKRKQIDRQNEKLCRWLNRIEEMNLPDELENIMIKYRSKVHRDMIRIAMNNFPKIG